MNVLKITISLYILWKQSRTVTAVEGGNIELYPPAWTKAEIAASDTIDKHTLGYCAEENERCGYTEVEGGMGGRWVYCCAGLWCSPDPATSANTYSIRCNSAKLTAMCWYYEYYFKKNVCKRDDYYPPLPPDYMRWDESKPNKK